LKFTRETVFNQAKLTGVTRAKEKTLAGTHAVARKVVCSL